MTDEPRNGFVEKTCGTCPSCAGTITWHCRHPGKDNVLKYLCIHCNTRWEIER